MSTVVQVHLLPELADPACCVEATVVIIDILRATTTVSWALDQGAAQVRPCLTVDEARQLAEATDRDQVMLGGERHGMLIDGFDLGNSPQLYESEAVQGKTILFTTSNGTRALHRFRAAGRVLLGSFLNLNAVLALTGGNAGPVHLVCAGTDGAVTAEDVLFAGALACGLQRLNGSLEPHDSTSLAMDFFRANSQNADSFLAAMRGSQGGRNLQRLGFDRDIEFASRWDRTAVVPQYFADRDLVLRTTPDGPVPCVLPEPH